jgi:hypothetical protein
VLLAVFALAASAPADTGRVLWRADGEQPLVDEWAEYSTAPNCAVTSDTVATDTRVSRVTAPHAQGAYAYEFKIEDGDACYGERAEIGQDLPPRPHFSASRAFRDGDDRWISFQVYLGRDFRMFTSGWDVIAQWKQLVAPPTTPWSPMLALQVHDGGYYLENADSNGSGRSCCTIPTRLARAIRARWARFSFHIKFSADPAVGFVEIWGDPDGRRMRRLLRRKHMWTLKRRSDGTPLRSHARIGIYRDSRITGPSHLYVDGYTVATTRVAAEWNAFSTLPTTEVRETGWFSQVGILAMVALGFAVVMLLRFLEGRHV